MVGCKEEIGMICWRCGHSKELHVDSFTQNSFTLWDRCDECRRNTSRKTRDENTFWQHKFEDNLTFIERKAKENNLI